MNLPLRPFAAYLLLAACVAGIFALRPGYAPEPLLPLSDEAIDALPPAQPLLPQTYAFPVTLSLCPKLAVANAPPADAGLHIIGYTATATINGVTLARAPVETACLSSGFGARNGQVHTGVDLYNPDPVNIYAAADGTVRRATYRDDFGNMLVLDHGHGVFTRYAHLDSMANLAEGDTVLSGEVIGIMGNTAARLIPRHLHYEILTGDWGEQSGSFALTPIDPMAFTAQN
jgi:murein DD-endopeptidase MepM/ murein hydrolase activator NlpD